MGCERDRTHVLDIMSPATMQQKMDARNGHVRVPDAWTRPSPTIPDKMATTQLRVVMVLNVESRDDGAASGSSET